MKRLTITLITFLLMPACDSVEYVEISNGSLSYFGSRLNGQFIPFVIEEYSDDVCESSRLPGWLTIYENGEFEMKSHQFLTLCTDTDTRSGGGKLHWGDWSRIGDDFYFDGEDPSGDFTGFINGEDDDVFTVYMDGDTLEMSRLYIQDSIKNRQVEIEEQIIQNFKAKNQYENL